jgi:hypothetical protein
MKVLPCMEVHCCLCSELPLVHCVWRLVPVPAGGATKSDLWLQIHADVSNLPLRLTE